MSKSMLLRAVVLASVPTLVLSAAPIQSADQVGADAFVTADHPLAALVPTTPLSDGGINAFGVGGGPACVVPFCATDGGTQNFSLSAHSGKRGDYGQWSVRVTSPDGITLVKYTVDVECVHIHGGNRGTIRGVAERVEPTGNVFGVTEGETILLGIKDAGDPSAGQPDDFFTPHMDVFPWLSCKDIFYVENVNNVDQGNVLVKMD